MIRKKIYIVNTIGLIIVCIMLVSCSVMFANNNSSIGYILPNLETSEDLDVVTERISVNQYNNLSTLSFSLMIDGTIFFTDSKGIYKTDKTFDNIEILVHNPNYAETIEAQGIAFGHLQYHNGRIFFRDRLSQTLISMNLDGSGLETVLSVSDIANDRYIMDIDEDEVVYAMRLAEYVVAGDKVHFNYFDGIARLMSYDMITGEVHDYEIIDALALTITPDNQALRYLLDFTIPQRLTIADGTVVIDIKNYIELFNDLFDKGYLFIVQSTTISEGRVAFHSTVHPYEPVEEVDLNFHNIFITDENGYAEVIYRAENSIEGPINAINNWIYFMSRTPDGYVHMYRIKNDGSILELVYENMYPTMPQFATFPVMNILSEDIILFKKSPTDHDTYALIRDTYAGQFTIQHISEAG